MRYLLKICKGNSNLGVACQLHVRSLTDMQSPATKHIGILCQVIPQSYHITLLNVRNPVSWRQNGEPKLWLEDFRTEGNKPGCLGNITELCLPKGKQLEHFVEKTAKFIRNPPSEPLCYRRLLVRGYGLDKVNLGMIEPKDKPASKRKSRDAVSAKGIKVTRLCWRRTAQRARM